MVRLSLIVALSCAAFLTCDISHAQTPQVSGPAARAITQPRIVLMTRSARAQLASRLAGETIAPVAITDTRSVSVLAPVVGDPAAPTLAMEIRRGTWLTTGPDPRAVIDTYSSEVTLKFRVAAGVRHLVVCDMGPSSALTLRSDFGGPAMSITWEGDSRGAVLVPARDADGQVTLHFTSGGAVRSCEVSRIR